MRHSPPDHADIRRATEDVELRSHPSLHPIGGANSRLHFWQPFLPYLRVLGRDDCSPTNLPCRKTACFDLATDCRQTNIVLTRELTKRIRPLHFALLTWRAAADHAVALNRFHLTAARFPSRRHDLFPGIVSGRLSLPVALRTAVYPPTIGVGPLLCLKVAHQRIKGYFQHKNDT